MARKILSLVFILALVNVVGPAREILAQDEEDYAAREAEAPGLEGFTGGFYMMLAVGVVAAVGYFVYLCGAAVWDWIIPDRWVRSAPERRMR